MQRVACDDVQKMLDKKEKMNHVLESMKRELDRHSRVLRKLEMLTECERQKPVEEKQQNDARNNSLQMASVERKRADENIPRLIEELKRLRKEALKKILELQKELNKWQKLELEIEELKGRLEVMKHFGDGDAANEKKMQEMTEELNQKIEDMNRFEKADEWNNLLQIASVELVRADENVLRLAEEQKRAKDEALKKILELEKQLNKRQMLELEIEQLKGQLEVMKHFGDDDAANERKMQEMTKELNQN